MIKSLIFDLAKVFLFPKESSYKGGLNDLYDELNEKGGYNFTDYFYLHEEQLEYVRSFKNKYPLYIITSGKIQNDPAIKSKLDEIFTQIFSAEKMEMKKFEPEIYTKVAQEIAVPPHEIVFVDDNSKNISAAKNAGLIGVLYADFKTFKKDFEKLNI